MTRAQARTRGGTVRAAGAACLVIGLLLGGCGTLLPSSRTETLSDWNTHAEAAATLGALAPYTATRPTVHAQGLDPSRNPAVTMLHFADLLQRFAPATLVEPHDIDQGIRDCLRAGQRCTGYAIAVEKRQHQRVGSFWLDSLNFRRETLITGWRVDALLVFVDDALVYRLVGGKPALRERDLRRNPLGPLQGWGEQLAPALRP